MFYPVAFHYGCNLGLTKGLSDNLQTLPVTADCPALLKCFTKESFSLDGQI